MNQPAVDHYTREFTGLQFDAPDWLSSIRRDAFDAFRSEGFPTLRHENWKYTDVRPLIKREFCVPQQADEFDREFVKSAGFADAGSHELVFTNGRYRDELFLRRKRSAGYLCSNTNFR